MRKFLSFMMAVLFAGSLMATLPTSPIWEAKALADIADGSTVIIISNSTAATNIALPSTATTNNPAKVACTVTTSDGLTTITPPDGTTLQDLAWTVTKNGDYFKFFTEGSTTSRLYLTGLSSNTAIRVGTATSSYDNFVMGAVGKLLEVMNGDNRGSRFVGPNDNNGTDWRSYNSETGSNYKSAQLTFYVLKTTKTIYLNTGGTTLWGVDSPEFFAHSWGSADDDAHLTLEQGNIFKADIPIANTSVVFVRQKGGTSTIVWSGDDFYNKTADLTIPTDGKNCYTITGWGENEGTWGTYTPPTFTDVYFVNTEDWPEANIKLYGWLGSDNNGWPGVAMAKTGDKVNGFDVYTAKINDTYTTVIISNNGSDTERSGDQPFDAATPCFYNGVWYASLGAIPANCATINAAANGASMTLNAGAVVVYANGKYAFVKDASGSALIFDNSSNHGLTTGDTITADIAGSVSVYKNLPEFVAATFPITARKAGEAPEIPVATEEPQLTNLNQVVVFQGVTFASSEYSSKSIVGTWNSKSVNFYDNWNQAIVFDLDKTYDITAAYSVYNTTLQAYIISAEPQAKYYITGNAALVGADKAWNPAAVKATADSYTFLDLPAGDYKLKVTLDGTWNDGMVKGFSDLTTVATGLRDEDGDDHNIGFTLADKGDVTVTFNATKFELEGDFAVNPYTTWFTGPDNWDGETESNLVYDYATQVATVTIAQNKNSQWKAQVKYHGEPAKAGKIYDVSLKLKSNVALGGITFKYQDDAEMVYVNQAIELKADEELAFSRTSLIGKDGNGVLVLDFGWAQAGTVITISDVVITEKDMPDFFIAGTMTDWNDHKIAVDGESYELNLEAGDHKLKVVTTAGNWLGFDALTSVAENLRTDIDNNVCFTLAEAGKVTVNYNATAFTLEGSFALKLPVVALAGTMNTWTAEVLTPAEDNLTASITVDLVQGVDSFKIISDGIWLSLAGADAENLFKFHRDFTSASHINGVDITNFVIDADMAGEYTFTWTYADSTLAITFPQAVYTVAGDAVLFTSNWDPADDANDMPFDDVNGVFYWGADDVVLLTGNIEFKVVKNHDWNNGANAWPAENYVLNIAQDGKYDVLITFNAETKEIVATATFKEPVEVDPTAKLMGIPDWNGADMDLALDKLSASVTMHLTPSDADGDTLTFKMKINGGWRSNGYLYHRGFVGATDIVDNVDDNMLVVVDIEGDYTFTWTFADNALEITFPAKPEPNYYLIGSKQSWEIDNLTDDLKFAANPDAEGEYILTVALEAGELIKVVEVVDGDFGTWYPGGWETDYLVDAAHAGAAKTIYFRPAGNAEWEAFHTGGFFFIAANDPATGINNTDANAKVEKVLENCQVFIIKNGQIFNVTGQLVK